MADGKAFLEFWKIRPSEIAISLAFAFGLSIAFYSLGFSAMSLAEFLAVAVCALIIVRIVRLVYRWLARWRSHEKKQSHS